MTLCQLIRNATLDDLAAIARVTDATGQAGEWSGSDPAYVTHLMNVGRVVVAEVNDVVVGFAATREIRGRDRSTSMLCDLFVDPSFHGRGLGRALLSDLWPDPSAPRMTFSSQHPYALPLYTSVGLDAWWPLLYLEGDARSLPSSAAWTVERSWPRDVGALELSWTGCDRTLDHQAWAQRPDGTGIVAALDGRPMMAGTAAGPGLEHLAVDPDLNIDLVADGALAVLAALDGRAQVCLPAPHPAVRPLLAAGWRVSAMDIFMATNADLLDDRRAVPSPALA